MELAVGTCAQMIEEHRTLRAFEDRCAQIRRLTRLGGVYLDSSRSRWLTEEQAAAYRTDARDLLATVLDLRAMSDGI